MDLALTMADWPPDSSAPPVIDTAPHQHIDSDDGDDDRLMAAFACGDARAFDCLYERHRQALYRFVRRLLGSALAAQADEVFQDTWLRVVKARDRYVPNDASTSAPSSPAGASFRTWLFTLAHHRAIDLLRRSGRETSLPDDDDAPFTPLGEPWLDWPPTSGGGATQDEGLFWRRAGARLLVCLDELPPAQRAVFLLHHEDEQRLDDIARTLELGFETAKSRLRYAMSKLRVCMGAYLGPDVMGQQP